LSERLQRLELQLGRALAARGQPLFLVLDAQHRLLEWHGDGRRYGLEPLQHGQPLAERLPILASLQRVDGELQAWHYVALDGMPVCHVNVLPQDGGWGVALIDASDEHREQQQRQQLAHELLLLRGEREQLIARLEQANALKSEFIAHMSHEFRTPLTAVLGYSEALRERRPDDPELQQHLAAVERGARHLMNLVENLLDQARVELDRLQLNPGPCDLRAVAEETAQMLGPAAERKGLRLTIRFDDQVPERTWLDPTRLRQVLFNLVGNAIKFTEQGGVEVGFDWDAGRLRITVADSGPGIAVDEAERIFEAYRQGRNARRFKGAGLGLTISRALVRAMGGELRLTGTGGPGARFEFEVPAAAVDAGASAGRNPLDGCRVVLADDDPDLLELLRLYLSDAGCAVETVADGSQVLPAVQRTRPAAVLLDLRLGEADGARLAAQLRASGYRGRIAILSASEPIDPDNPPGSEHVDVWWTKPIGRVELLRRLSEILD
jgi:signal transduction histidine kinase